jgi:hypothetical protein
VPAVVQAKTTTTHVNPFDAQNNDTIKPIETKLLICPLYVVEPVMLTRRSTWRESGCRELSSIYERWSPGLARVGCLSNAKNVFGTLYFIETSYILETPLMYFPVKFWGHYKRKSSDS